MTVFADPAAIFRGELVFTAPHMDDEVLACGGTIASLPDKERIHVVYATNGSRSPVPAFDWIGSTSADLPTIRRAEARAALDVLGIPEQNRQFLDFPDGQLQQNVSDVQHALEGLLERVRPSHVFVPFRFDRHPDHIALHAAAVGASRSLPRPIQLVEYFVYYRWRLLPGGDIRKIIQPEHLIRIDISGQSQQKQRALECYVSQATCFFNWQDRPILPAARVVEVSRSPELFLLHDPDHPGTAVFARLRHWIPVAHRLEPRLKQWKDELRLLARAPRARPSSRAMTS
jgi:LmbE family N-acetylglucosaminyl deacetylase